MLLSLVAASAGCAPETQTALVDRGPGADEVAAPEAPGADPSGPDVPRAIEAFAAASRRDVEATCDCVVVPHDPPAAASCVDQSLADSTASPAFVACLEERLGSGPAEDVDDAVGALGCLGTALDARAACLDGDPGYPKAAPDCEDVAGRAACDAAAESLLESCWDGAPTFLGNAFTDCS